MKFKQIKINNFLSLHDVTFDFPSGLVLIDGWNHDLNSHNGVGKSALLNAITYAIYGKTPQNISLSSLVKEGSDGMLTEIELEIYEQSIRIVRKRSEKSGKVKLFINGELQKGVAKDIETNILRLIQLTFEQFIQVIYIFQDSANRFIDLNDTDKKKFLSTVLNLEIYDEAYKLAHDEITNRNLEESNVSGQLTALQNELERIKTQIGKYNIQLKYFNENYENTIKEYNTELQQCQNELVELNKNQNSNQTEIITQLEIKKTELINKISAVNTAKSELKTTDMQRHSVKSEKDKVYKELTALNSNICPTCERTWSTPEANNRKQKLNNLVQELEKKHSNAVAASEEYKKILGSVDEVQLNKDYETTLQHINYISESKNKTIYQIQITEQKITNLEQRIANKQQESNMIQKNITDLTNNQTDVEQKLNNIKKQQTEIEKIKEELLEIKNIFSPKGVRAYVFNNILNQFNGIIANYLNPLTGGLFTFEMRVDEEKGKIYDYLEYAGRERNFNSLSGGERKRISLAVDLALSNIICSRLSIFPNILFIDEGFNGICALGRGMIISVLKALNKSKDAIYVIDHASEFKTQFNATIKLVKQSGSTYIE